MRPHLAPSPFSVGSEYTRNEIHAQVGGSKQSYLPTSGGKVVAACITKRLNPLAPNIILCGQGLIIASSGFQLAKQRDPIPVFVKLAVNRWQLQGCFRVQRSHSSGPEFQAAILGSGRAAADVALVIEMELG